VVASRDWESPGIRGDEDEDEEPAFTFARGSAATVEELDLAPMVDVAFQLVLFFMVTATTVLYKTLEVPKPSSETPPGAVAQGRSKTIDDLREDYIVVEIDPSGAFKIDQEPVAADMNTIVERLRSARDKTARLSMLLSTDHATPHRHAVLAIDAANEIGLRIAVARPRGKQAQAPPPTIFPINNAPRGEPKTGAAGKGA
jgi:biopolymer transport protein ExbD